MSRKLMPSERFSITFKQSDFLEKESGRLNISKSELLRRMLDFYIEYKEKEDQKYSHNLISILMKNNNDEREG